ncbi:hypothetical protein HII31_03810 [Pseudocercospora fuligena]|uniref:F-box domain-containing protein n=1 Tax=Pseudocercospora fuligena TaxID=685502 RepID=A0A8H6RN35_9PEZI|nr:hypothetical protein HII31_03810 [Pseudocercospora fuligena]
MADTTSESPKLRFLLESLPQELYDEIFSLVIDMPTTPPNFVSINAKYKPPKALQLCRKIRKTFATEYYTKSNFSGHLEMATKWKKSLPVAHRRLIIAMLAWGYNEDGDEVIEWSGCWDEMWVNGRDFGFDGGMKGG